MENSNRNVGLELLVTIVLGCLIVALIYLAQRYNSDGWLFLLGVLVVAAVVWIIHISRAPNTPRRRKEF